LVERGKGRIAFVRRYCGLTSEKYYRREENINRLVEALEGSLEERGYLKELKENGIEFKNGRVVIGGIETRIPEDYWREREANMEVYRDAFRLAERIITRPELPLRRKLKDLLDEDESNSF